MIYLLAKLLSLEYIRHSILEHPWKTRSVSPTNSVNMELLLTIAPNNTQGGNPCMASSSLMITYMCRWKCMAAYHISPPAYPRNWSFKNAAGFTCPAKVHGNHTVTILPLPNLQPNPISQSTLYIAHLPKPPTMHRATSWMVVFLVLPHAMQRTLQIPPSLIRIAWTFW